MTTDASEATTGNVDSHAEASASEVSVPTRRSRISLACQSCRSRKTKCNGNQPACSTCRHLRIKCVYAKPSHEPDVRRSTSRAQLAHKVRELEHELHAAKEFVAESRPVDISPTVIHDSRCDHLLNDGARSQDTDTVDPDIVGNDFDPEANEDTHAARIFQDQHASDFGYFGPSSNHAFFRSVSRCFFHFLRSAPLQHDQSQLLTTAMLTDDGNEAKASTASHMASLENPFLATLPAMSESLLMLDRFFATTAPILPFIAKATLITSLRELTSGSCEPGSWTKRALVNIAFAHSCMVVGDIRSDIFFRRSLHCVISETLRGANIRLIQALLLVTSYQQQQQMSVKSWTYHALAVKAAFQLGLHCPSSYKEISPSDAELSKRLWYCLINQDRMLCMCLGRPCLIPSHYICTPRLEDPNSTCRISSIGHDYQTESLLHHKYQTDLYCIVASVLSDMYQHNIEREESLSTWTLLATRLKLFHLFEEWNRKLDPGLELITPQEVSTILSSQRVEDRFRLSLTMHYYRALILLNGPVLTQVLDIAIGSSHTNAEAVPFVEHCLPTLRSDFVALENMHQILSVLSQSEDFLNQNNMWWLCNHASSSVAMHLFCLALLYQVHPNLEVLIGIPAVKIRQVLGECLDNMRLLQRTSVLFRRAREAIHRFTQKLDSVSSVRERNTPSTVVSDIARPFDFDFTQYDLSTTNDLLGQSDLDLLLGDGLYC